MGSVEGNVDDVINEKSVSHLPVCKRNVFNQYAQMFRLILASWVPIYSQLKEDKRNKELDDLILPSNEVWRHRVYYRLVELQRECDAEVATKRADEDKPEMESGGGEEPNGPKDWEWGAGTRGYPLKAKANQGQESGSSLIGVGGVGGSMTEACVQPGWRISDIILAAKVLQKILPSPVYSNEAEMRRVFGLVYDVLRYKNILNRALEDVGFWYRNSLLRDREKIVWLLLYDMQGRKFARRGEIAAVEERERVFKNAGLMDIEIALLDAKTHLAASVSRLRIGGSALNLDELLPTHLRIIEGVTWDDGSIASGWVNTAKMANKNEFLKEMTKIGFAFCEDCDATELDELSYAFDSLCPKIVNMHDRAREALAVSNLVREHRFVFLERSLCLGAAALAQAIRIGRFCGPVVLTHSLAPRHTGYLAGLLADIEDAGRLLAFGAGDRCYEYETYLNSLGVTLQQCRVFPETYVSSPATAELERATVVLAVPPCSYTGVRDIVDLAVARGGDTNLLETLTSASTGGDEGKRPRTLLADQLSTLKYALTRPNVQFLIYEAHTILPSETTEMIRQVVDYANRMAVEKYIREHPQKKKSPPKEGSAGKVTSLEKVGKVETQSDENPAGLIAADVTIPDSDLFEVRSIDDIYGENTGRMLDPGCFLALIRRKEMMQFDSLFMIKVAESKGLFGDPNAQPKPKPEPVVVPAQTASLNNRKEAKSSKIEFDRIMAPTYSSLSRTARENGICPRHKKYDHDICKDRIPMGQLASSITIYEESNIPNYASLLKPRQKPKESQKRLNVPSRFRLTNKTVNEKDFQVNSRTSLSRRRAQFPSSNSQRHLKQEETTLASLLNPESSKCQGQKKRDSSSTVLRTSALARAIRRIPLENDDADTELDHPDYSVIRRLPVRHRLEAVTERLHEFSRFLKTSPDLSRDDFGPSDFYR